MNIEPSRLRLFAIIAAAIELGAVACATDGPAVVPVASPLAVADPPGLALPAIGASAASDSSPDAGDADASVALDASAAIDTGAPAPVPLGPPDAGVDVAKPATRRVADDVPAAKPRSGGRGLQDITGIAHTNDSCGAVSRPTRPLGDVSVSPASVEGDVPGVDRVVASLRPRLRRCYLVGLDEDPTQQGRISVEVTIAPTGEVSSSKLSANTGLSASVASCIERVFRNATFAAHGGGAARVRVALSLGRQGG